MVCVLWVGEQDTHPLGCSVRSTLGKYLEPNAHFLTSSAKCHWEGIAEWRGNCSRPLEAAEGDSFSISLALLHPPLSLLSSSCLPAASTPGLCPSLHPTLCLASLLTLSYLLSYYTLKKVLHPLKIFSKSDLCLWRMAVIGTGAADDPPLPSTLAPTSHSVFYPSLLLSPGPPSSITKINGKTKQSFLIFRWAIK